MYRTRVFFSVCEKATVATSQSVLDVSRMCLGCVSSVSSVSQTSVSRVSRECLESVPSVSVCLESVSKVSRKCLCVSRKCLLESRYVSVSLGCVNAVTQTHEAGGFWTEANSVYNTVFKTARTARSDSAVSDKRTAKRDKRTAVKLCLSLGVIV